MYKALVLNLVVFFLLSNVALAIDTSCIEKGEHKALTYVLVDRSDKLENTTNLEQSLLVAQKMFQAGERVIVGVSTGKASDTRVLMDFVKPENSLWVSKLKIRAAEKKFNDCFGGLKAKLLEQNEEHAQSAILETLQVVSKAMATDPSPKKRIILISDMTQNSSTISFYSSKSINPEALVKKVKKEYLLPKFKGVEFHVAGVGQQDNEKKNRQIEAFWGQYVDAAGGTLKYYGPVLFN